MIDLTNTEILLDLTTIKYGKSSFDLHNDYDCTDINYKFPDKTISFLFQPRVSASLKSDLRLLFEDVSIVNFKVNLKRTEDSCTLDSLYRGRYEKDGDLFEISRDGESVFYIEFYEGDSFMIFSKRVTLIF